MKATRINIRKRQISNGRSSLYLDYYPRAFDRIKKRMVRHETLYFYVYDRPKTVADRQHNDEMMINLYHKCGNLLIINFASSVLESRGSAWESKLSAGGKYPIV